MKTAKFGQAQVGRLYEAQLTVISPVLDLFAQGSHKSSAILLRCNERRGFDNLIDPFKIFGARICSWRDVL